MMKRLPDDDAVSQGATLFIGISLYTNQAELSGLRTS